MTRPKADSDPWLTDMVTRDREVAKTVVYGIREIHSLLRSIRDGINATNTNYQRENEDLRHEIQELWRALRAQGGTPVPKSVNYERCDTNGCSLPMGHLGNHKGSLRSA